MPVVLVGLVVLGFAVRFAVGMIATQFDGDEASLGMLGIGLLHGHLPVVQSSGHYLGATEGYIEAPFIAVFGPTRLAIRLALSLVGAGYVAAMYGLGLASFRRRPPAITLAAVAAVFPLFAISYGVKARGYGALLFMAAICLWLAVRIAWTDRGLRWSDWGLFGLAAGVGLWVHPLIMVTLAVCGLMLLCRAPITGWLQTARGIGIAVIGALVGYSPWLIYSISTHFAGLQSLRQAGHAISVRHAAYNFAQISLPLFIGWAGPNSCNGHVTVPPWLADVFVGGLALAVLALRRHSLAALVRGHVTALEPIDYILVLGIVSVAAVLVGPFNAVGCEPRYLMPFAIPLAVALVLPLVNGAVPRVAAAAAAIACVAISAVTVAVAAPDGNLLPYPGASGHVDLAGVITALEGRHPGAIWADYWLAGPLAYFSDERLPVGEYLGYAGFPDQQARARAGSDDAVWLFPKGDPLIATFEQACASRGITYQRSEDFGLVWYQHLSAHLLPDDIGWGTSIE